MFTGKPIANFDCNGSFGNFPVFHDGSAVPNNSPILAGTTVVLKVPRSALQLVLTCNGANAASVVVRRGGVAAAGTDTVLPNQQATYDVGGMNGHTTNSSEDTDEIAVTAGATSPVAFRFNCATYNGE